jgi:Arc/MetJ-type ribon-helix-helix transcriptional regulator
MAQIAVRLSDEELALLDEAVAEGVVASRAAGVRAGVALLARQLREERIAEEYRRAYEQHPLEPDEEAFLHAAAEALPPA